MKLKMKPLVLSPFVRLIIICAAAKFIIQILTATNYGYFMDELYTIALSKHLAFGYVDVPPLTPLIVALSRQLFGESLLAVHIIPSLTGSAALVFVCLITREFGGKLYATGISALGFIMVPIWLITNSYFSYDCIDQLILAIFLYVLVRFIKTGNKKLWIGLGILAGIAFITKATILFLGPGFILALLISKYRKHLLTPWPWIGLGIFLVISSPYILWEYANNWTTLEYWRTYSTTRVYPYSFLEYLHNLLLTMNPLLIPILLIGSYRIFRRMGDTNYYFLGIMFLVTAGLVFFQHTRSLMLAAMIIPLIAAGAIFVEEKLSVLAKGKGIKIAVTSFLLAGLILVAPSALPIVPVNMIPAYASHFRFLYSPFKYGNMFYPLEFTARIGWEDLVMQVAQVYDELPLEDQKKCGILANWYGTAGAIDLLGQKYGLPHAVCGHLTYYLWGPGEYSWDVMIVVSKDISSLSPLFEKVEDVAIIRNEYAVYQNKDLHIYVCRGMKVPASQAWKSMKSYL